MRASPELPQVPRSHSLYWFFLISVCTFLIFVSGDLVQIRPMRDASLVFRVGRESESKSPCGWTTAQTHRCWVWPYFAQGRSRERQFLEGESTEPGQNDVPWVLCRSSATLYPWFSSFVYTDRVDFICCLKPKRPYLTHLGNIWVTPGRFNQTQSRSPVASQDMYINQRSWLM